MDFCIEPMTAGDWPQVRAIYEDGIATGNATFESEAPSWEQWDTAHLATCRLVARRAGTVVGWAALTPVSRRQCYAGVAEVSVYVAAAARGRAVGRALLERLITESEKQGIWTLQGSTFPENAASLRLQARCGFRVLGRRERVAQMAGVWRDTLLTERRSRAVHGARPTGIGAPPTEKVLAWVGDGIAASYIVWLFGTLWQRSDDFARMFDGLGSALPAPTRILVANCGWLYPSIVIALVLALVGKEILVRDKRVSLMVTLLVALAAEFVAHWMLSVYYLPLFALIRQMNG